MLFQPRLFFTPSSPPPLHLCHTHTHTQKPLFLCPLLWTPCIKLLCKTDSLLNTHTHTHTQTRAHTFSHEFSQPNAITQPIQDTPYLLNCIHKHKEDTHTHLHTHTHTHTHWHKISTFTVSPTHTEYLIHFKVGQPISHASNRCGYSIRTWIKKYLLNLNIRSQIHPNPSSGEEGEAFQNRSREAKEYKRGASREVEGPKPTRSYFIHRLSFVE